MNDWRVVSDRFPYISLLLTLGGSTQRLDALLDTGFDGDLVVPADYAVGGMPPAFRTPAYLADGTEISIPAYTGRMRIGEITIAPVSVLTLGSVTLIGTNLVRRFKVTLDHGERVIIEP